MRLLAVLFFLCAGSCFKAIGYPDYLLHKSYAVQFYGLDSMLQTLARGDSAKAEGEMAALKKWAAGNDDEQLAYGFALLGYSYSFIRKKTDNGMLEKGLPVLIRQLDDKKLYYLEAAATNLLAKYYWENKRTYSAALEFSLQAHNIYNRFDAADFPQKSQCLYELALDYYRFKDYRNAKMILAEAMATAPQYYEPHYYTLLNTIGLCYRKLGVYDSAEYYFKEGYDLVGKENLEVWRGIIGGNLGITYYLEGHYQEAIPLLQADITEDLARNKHTGNGANSLAVLGDTYLRLGDTKKGLETLLQSYAIIEDGQKWTDYELLEGVYPYLAKAYAANGNYQMAYNFSDSAKRVADSSAVQRSALILASAQQKTDNELHVIEVQKHQREHNIQVLIWAFLIVGIILLLAVIFSITRNYKNQKITNKLLSEEKKRSDDLLLNILPSEVADELKATGTAVARHFEDVTVLFTDFVDFTQAGERMTPKELIDELHYCFKAFDEITGTYDIEKIKTIGDAYLAVCGLPVPDALHAEHITRSAIAIRDFMRNRRRERGEGTFQVRIGIHSGSVVAGIVGVKKFAYDIWGDTVNTAARMEQNSEAGKINISQTTYELVKDKFECVYRGEIQAKNKGEMRMYFVA